MTKKVKGKKVNGSKEPEFNPETQNLTLCAEIVLEVDQIRILKQVVNAVNRNRKKLNLGEDFREFKRLHDIIPKLQWIDRLEAARKALRKYWFDIEFLAKREDELEGDENAPPHKPWY